jgi:hypothetical protein
MFSVLTFYSYEIHFNVINDHIFQVLWFQVFRMKFCMYFLFLPHVIRYKFTRSYKYETGTGQNSCLRNKFIAGVQRPECKADHRLESELG